MIFVSALCRDPRRRPRWALLALSLAVATAGVAAPRMAPTTEANPSQGLQAAADEISAAIAHAVVATQMRAEGIAATPMLRAAIYTDAATLQDLASGERLFQVDAGETIELFEDDHSMARLPAFAAPVHAGTRLEVEGNTLLVTASAPVVGQNGRRGGVLALRRACDLSSILPALPGGATLTGLAYPLVLVAAPVGAVTQRVPIPTLPALALEAAVDRPVATARAWPKLVRTTSFIVSVLLLAMFGEVATRRRVRA